MKDVYAQAGVELAIGRRGENLATRVIFDVTAWQKEYGQGTAHLIHMRNGDKYPYPVVVEQEEGKVLWTVSETDLAVVGKGRAELQYWVGDTRVKSAVFATRTAQSLDNEGPSPDAPEASWVEKVLKAAESILSGNFIPSTSPDNSGGSSSGGSSSGGSSSGGSSSGGSTIVPSGGSTGVVGAVLYNIAQALTNDQRRQARSNIGAASADVESQVSGLVSDIAGVGNELSSVRQDVGKIQTRITNNEGDISTITQRVTGIDTRVSNVEGEYSALHQTVDEIKTTVESGDNSSELKQTVDEIKVTVENQKGEIALVKLNAGLIENRVEDAEGNISVITQEVDRIKSVMEDPDGDYSSVIQRVDSVETRVANAEGDISTLTQTVDEMKAVIEDPDGNSSSVIQRVDSLESQVASNTGNISTLAQASDKLTSRVSKTETDIATNKDGIEENTAKYTELKQTVEDISFTVSDPINGGTNRYVTITLTVGDNAYTGVVMIDGNVDVSGQLSAEALYATLGDIARLKVDSLSTSRRIPMYLKRDKSDDNYIDISEQHITLRRAWTDGSTEQARDDFGAKLYWEQDIEDAVLGADGYPYVDGARVFVTTEITDWPVMVYSYDSGDRLKVFFDEYNNYGPRMVWGEGDGTSSGKGRGYIEKLGLSFDIYNLGTDGVKRGVFMSNDFTDIVGQRRPTKIAFSGDVCNITLEGGITEKLTFNRTNGVITSVTDSNGHTCTLEGLE